MYYGITLTLVKFSRFLDEIGATQLASVSGRFASFKYESDSRSSRQTTSVFHINHSFWWQSVDLFLGLFSDFGRSLNWEVDNLVEFVHICNYFMIYERYVSDIFRATFRQNYCRSFPENQFCEVLFENSRLPFSSS